MKTVHSKAVHMCVYWWVTFNTSHGDFFFSMKVFLAYVLLHTNYCEQTNVETMQKMLVLRRRKLSPFDYFN